MATLTGTNTNVSHAGDVRIKSIAVTPRDAAIDTVTLHPYLLTGEQGVMTFKASNGVTSQFYFSDLSFLGGVSIVPSATCEGFIVEYEPIG